ncbi:MAG: SDR family oxidoreductase [Deltaproteobacteria bacterium]|nr:SDR family oxidoreductase [Deltaproteobacteria bacterium]
MTREVLITGGLGYAGGRIARFLAGRPDMTLRLGTRLRHEAAPEWLKNGRVVRMDFESPDSLAGALAGVNCVIHLAAMNELDSAANPEGALIVNGLYSLKLLNAAMRAGAERFIYFSTGHVYGSPLEGRITEDSVTRPVHPYAITHRVSEDFVLAAHDRKKLVGVVLRLTNGFGAPERADVNRWTLLVNDLCRQAVTTGALVLRSSGIQYRDFITLEDVARAAGHFAALPAEACGKGLFNLGGQRSMTILEMTERISARCQAVLGFRPRIVRPEAAALEDGAARPLDFCIDRLKATGFTLTGDIDAEIDATLCLCKKAFGQGA